jgi:hypothetical protein
MNLGTNHSLASIRLRRGVSSWFADDGVEARLHIANTDIFLLMKKRITRRDEPFSWRERRSRGSEREFFVPAR